MEGSDHGFHEIHRVDGQEHLNGKSGVVTDVSAAAELGREKVEDVEIPMRSIAVRQETQWSESRRHIKRDILREDWC